MYTLLTQIARFFSPAQAPAGDGVAYRLMQSADLRAGQNNHEAQELRNAAFAYLSVVR